jgi:undecaprenyl-diphosphatase
MTSVVVLRHRRTAGLVLLAITVLIAVSRVVAHVHHIQDVAAGAFIGLVAAVAGFLCWWAVRDIPLVRRAAGRDQSETASPGATRAQ